MTILILLDTNIPILASEGRFNLEEEIKRLIPQTHSLVFLSASVRELARIEKKGKKLARAVYFARKMLEKMEIIDFNPPNTRLVDEIIVQFAKEKHPYCVVTTNDLSLKNKLRKLGIPVIFVRTLGHLELEGEIVL